MGYVKVVACIFYCVYLLCGTNAIIPMMYTKDSYNKWFYMWLVELWSYSWFLIFSGICRYVSNYMCMGGGLNMG